MADAVSTAVGVISLGIQVCQGLTSYYQSFKGQDRKIADILQHIDTLCNILEVIQTCLSNLNGSQLNAVPQVENSVTHCAAAITKLNDLLVKCRHTTIPTNSKERMQILGRKLVFPFQQSTLDDLIDTVKGMQGNTDLALHALQM